MTDFKFQEMLPLAEDRTGYRRLTDSHVSAGSLDGNEILKVAPEGLTLLAQQAFTDVAHLYRPSHLKLLAGGERPSGVCGREKRGEKGNNVRSLFSNEPAETLVTT